MSSNPVLEKNRVFTFLFLLFYFSGATCRNRTSDLLITNQLLYHLS